jgi:HlyD family secretion protein
MKRAAIPLAVLVSLTLIALSGWLGYQSIGWSGVSLPSLASASPTPSTPTRTVAVTRGDVRQVLTVPGSVSPARQQSMGFSGSGRVVEIMVRAGDTVTKGQTLARQDTETLNLALSQAQANVASKQASLDKLKAGPSDSDLASANAAVRDAQVGLQNAQMNLSVVQNSDTVMRNVRDREYEANWYEANYGESLHRFQAGKIDQDRLNLDYNNLLTAKEKLVNARTQAALAMSQANQQLANAQEAVRKSQTALADLKAGSSDADLKTAEASLQSAQLDLKQAEVNLAGSTLIAPFDGKVLSVSALAGDIVAADSAIMTIADLTQLEVQTTVGQEDVTQVQPGQVASLTFDARPGETYAGKVSRIVPTRAGTSGAVNYNVFVSLDKSPEGLLPGMTADADIVVAERAGVLTLPRRSIRARANATIQLQVVQGGQTSTRNVRIGLVGDLNVEVLSGLQEGDQVVAAQ